MVIYIEKWACPYCGASYPSEYRAKECARDCVDVEEPHHINIAVCEMCNQQFEEDGDAESCEGKHLKNDDLYYQKFLTKRNFEKLAQAAALPGQKKLLGD